jgi:hypothetical protein
MNPCQHGATCIDKLASYQCICAAGFTGRIYRAELFAGMALFNDVMNEMMKASFYLLTPGVGWDLGRVVREVRYHLEDHRFKS